MLRTPRWTAIVASIAVLASSLVAFAIDSPQAAFADTPTLTLSVSGNGSAILAGNDQTYSLSASNATAVDAFNLGFAVEMPIGVTFVSSSLGAPKIYDEVAFPASEPVSTAGHYLWVWEDAADLPAGAAFDLSLVVHPEQPVAAAPWYTDSTTVFPVGSSYNFSSVAYLSSDATYLPVFMGSTGVGGPLAIAATLASAGVSTSTPISAILIDKSEPSPEAELLRGVHDQTTVYSLRVENNKGYQTKDAVVVDYLPAGLEFLGCGTVDNTSIDTLTGLRYPEYPNSGDLTGTPLLALMPVSSGAANQVRSGCIQPAGVETVLLTGGATGTTLPDRLPDGVYTKVTFNLGDLPLGSVSTIRYRAAVPLYQNTMNWDRPETSAVVETAPTSTPANNSDTETQLANLDNNNGPSTRHGDGGDFAYDPTLSVRQKDDGDTWKNSARVEGNYQGMVSVPSITAPDVATVAAARRAVSDEDDETIYAMDLAIVKGVQTSKGSGDSFQFVPTEAAKFTLTVRSSEYTSSNAVVISDTVRNGLCPLIPADDPSTTADNVQLVVDGAAPGDISAYPADCAQGVTASNALFAPISGARIVSVTYFPSTGRFTMVLDPIFPTVADTIQANETHVITYPVLMRDEYQLATEYGPTTSGDSFVNQVEISGTSTNTPDVATLPTQIAAPQNVWDDSGVTVGSDFTRIDKQVMERSGVQNSATPCANPDPAVWKQGLDVSDTPTGYRMGDTVCYRLTVNFPADIATRNARVTDFLPIGVTYTDAAVAASSSAVVASYDPSMSSTGRLDWTLGTVGAGGDYYVPAGAVLQLYVWAKITSAPSTVAADKPQNLMKYRQENVLGQVFFLRDAAAFEREGAISLLKGVQAIGGITVPAAGVNLAGDQFGSNRDSLQVAESSVVTYRIDLTGLHDAVDGIEVWDALPVGIHCADVNSSSYRVDGAVPSTAPTCSTVASGLNPSSYNGRDVVKWTNVSIAAAVSPAVHGLGTLNYKVTIPAQVSVDTQLVNEASIVAYNSGSNVGADLVYHPQNSLDNTRNPTQSPAAGEEWNYLGDGMRDTSSVFLPPTTVTKSVTSPTDTNNSATQLVKGEIATYTYSVTIPAHTSVYNGALVDTMPSQLTRTATDATVLFDSDASSALNVPTATLPSGFSLDVTTGKLTFAANYDNTSNVGQVFTVTMPAYLNGTATIPSTVTNTATFSSTFTTATSTTDVYSHSANASVTTIGPAPAVNKFISKVDSTAYADVTDPGSRTIYANSIVQYTITVKNPGTVPTAFDTVVTDCVPVELTPDLASAVASQGSVENPTTSAAIASDAACTGTRVVWNVGSVAAGTTKTLTYNVSVLSNAGGLAAYVNKADLTAYTLPTAPPSGYRAELDSDNNATATIGGATITKTGQNLTTGGTCLTGTVACTGAIGDAVRYTIVVSLPANVSFYDSMLTDAVPAGMKLNSASVTSNAAGFTIDGPKQYTGTYVLSSPAVTTSNGIAAHSFLWYVSDGAAGGDIPSATAIRIFTITYDGVLVATSATLPAANATVANTASFAWHSVNDTGAFKTVSATRNLTVLAPNMTLTKKVNALDAIDVVAGGANFNYTITIANPLGTPINTTSAAYDLALTDAFPTGVTLIGSPTVSQTGTVSVVTNTPATNNWTIDKLDAGGSITITYPANILASPSIVPNAALTNVATITDYYSNDEANSDARHYTTDIVADAVVTPRFPVMGVSKTAATGVAYIGVGKTFTVVVSNSGQATSYSFDVDDTLPSGWEYVAGTSVLGGLAVGDPAISGASLSWSDTDAIWAAHDDLTAGSSATLTYTARPIVAYSWTASNTGGTVLHTNLVSVDAQDGSGATHNAGTTVASTADDYFYAASSSANAVIDRADLKITKTHGTSTIAGDAAGLTWTMHVENLGPDSAVGPIVVKDTLPVGVTFKSTTGTGTGWVVTGPVAGEYTFTHAGPLAKNAALPDIKFLVNIPSDTAAGTVITNVATVSGATFETVLSNNTDDDDVTVTAVADVSIDKNIAATNFVAGEDAVWTLTVANHGPSTSRGTSLAPIVVTDALPPTTDIDAATFSVPTGSDWTCTLTSSVLITCTYPHDILAGATAPVITVTTPVKSSKTGTLSNSATVTPVTPEPSPDVFPDTDTAAVLAVGSDADLQISKTIIGDGTLPAGGAGRYRVDVTNNGPSDSVDVFVLDTLPAGVHYDGGLTSSSTLPWSCADATPSAGLVTCELESPAGVLTNGESTWFEFDVTIDSNVAGDITNAVHVDARLTDDTNPLNDDDDVTIAALLNTELTIDKATTETLLDGGQIYDYTLDVANVDDADASTVTVTDTLDPQIKFVSADLDTAAGSPAWNTCVLAGEDADGYGGTLTCTLDDNLVTGTSAPRITITVQVAPEAYDVDGITNGAKVEWTNLFDPTVFNDTDSVTTPLKWLHYNGGSVCVSDVPWYDFTFTMAPEVDQTLPIVIDWYKDSNQNGVPEAATTDELDPIVDDPSASPVATYTIDIAAKTLTTDGPDPKTYHVTITGTGATRTISGAALWPGAAVNSTGVGIAWPGWRVALPGETPTWENQLYDPTLYGANLRAGALITMHVNPQTSDVQAYPASTVACVTERIPELNPKKVASVPSATANQSFYYTLNARNTALGATNHVILTDHMPADLHIVDVVEMPSTDPTVPDWQDCVVTNVSATGFGGTVTCTLDGWLGRAQTTPDVVIKVKVISTSVGKPIINHATVWWDDPDAVSDDGLELVTLSLNDDWLAFTGIQGLPQMVVLIVALLGSGIVLVSWRRRRSDDEADELTAD